ncbi:uncharacterized protein LOC132939002 [Metopolophium dirhodum]|uniref:uncharacterized protein LOC132938998 n=1 Tax=Metopolophium dirhodum TaxID=44670 RepID=UPI00299003B5|nr:uncharacterized protein LOC132938998 [Metopolophium dirhodum]XP_060861974.1 uncharacterized protein LOC132939002 [Metopolophium dirhodum]
MFTSMFKLLFNECEKKTKIATHAIEFEIAENTQKYVKELLTEIKKVNINADNGDSCSVSKNNIIDAIQILQDILHHFLSSKSHLYAFPKYSNKSTLVEHFDYTKCAINSFGKNRLVSALVKDLNTKRIVNQINNIQCLFTWNIEPINKKNVILWIWNKYGEYNLNISSSEFTLERFIGNLIISYEFFHKGEHEIAQIKILEIGKWLEELDKGTDEFYLSINTGLRHIIMATFIHMLFATNLTEECKWLLEDISSFANMDSKLRASVHAIRAAVLIEYSENLVYLSKACDMAKKACDLDPTTSHWYYIHSLALTAQRQLSSTHKLIPADDEINAIHQAIVLSNGKNPLFNYHWLVMDDISINKENQKIADMIKSIMNIGPKDPHLVVKCAKTLMTLPPMDRDFNLGVQYLIKAFQMSQNDGTVLKAIGQAIESYFFDEIRKKMNLKTTEVLQLETELGLIVKKHKNGEDPVPYLTDLVPKYNGLNQSKIISQLCSYTLLFTNHLRYSIEQFNKLIEQPEIVNNDIIVHHISSFGSKKFNLSELICNEIRLATNASGTSSDLSYYYEMLSKIIETSNFKIKDVDPFMKANLIVNSSAKSALTITVQSKTELADSDKNVTVHKNTIKNKKKGNPMAKQLQTTGAFMQKPTFGNTKKNKWEKVEISLTN